MTHKVALKAAIDFNHKTNFVFNKAGTPAALRAPGISYGPGFMKSFMVHQITFSRELLMDAITQQTGDAAGKLAAHVAAYLLLTVPGSYYGWETMQRMGHPIADLVELLGLGKAIGMGHDYGDPLMSTLGGPWGSFIYDTTRMALQETGVTDKGPGRERYITKHLLPSQVSRSYKAYRDVYQTGKMTGFEGEVYTATAIRRKQGQGGVATAVPRKRRRRRRRRSSQR